MMKDYEKAIEVCKRGLERNPDEMFIHMTMAAIYAELGQLEKARSSALEVLRIKPKITLAWCEKMIPWKDKEVLNRYVDALHNAGLK
jgi:tetratricopeptide (TPR) repeat protein